jgi:hypothetical protein
MQSTQPDVRVKASAVNVQNAQAIMLFWVVYAIVVKVN